MSIITFPSCIRSLGFYPLAGDSSAVSQLLSLGVRTIQLRVKDRDAQAIRQEVDLAVQAAKQYPNSQLFINDYWKLAVEMHAYGVHLGQEDLDEADLKSIQQAGLRIGVSTHTTEELDRVLKVMRPSYVALGPVYETSSKVLAYTTRGVEKVTEWKDKCNSPELECPLVAIGGITYERAPDVLGAGADSIAVIGAIQNLGDKLPAVVEQWLALWEPHRKIRGSGIKGLPPHYVIVGSYTSLSEFEERLTKCLSGPPGSCLVQIRSKLGSPDNAKQNGGSATTPNSQSPEDLKLFECAMAVAQRCGRTADILLNTDDIALVKKLGAGGIHFSSENLMKLKTRPLPFCHFLVSASCHTAEHLRQAAYLGIDCALVSQVKASTTCPPKSPPLGWEGLQALTHGIELPVYALGGMDITDLPAARKAGAIGIAGIELFWMKGQHLSSH